ncbi:unnamed protein product [Discula destructiva]
MLWTEWTTLVPLTVLTSLLLVYTSLGESRATVRHLLVASTCALVYAAGYVDDLTDLSPYNIYLKSRAHVNYTDLDRFCEKHFKMIAFGIAVAWVMRRALQTLWKPVPELIGILGVDVPDPPDVMLAGIGVDKATVNWARPHPNKPVQKFLIQVNGVVVGESPANQETAITVTGLKPSHFYNVRVIAVGANSFQAGSRIVRLRTFDRQGRPQLGNSRLPQNFEPEDHLPSAASREPGDENGPPRSPVPGIETANLPDGGSALSRDANTIGQVPRRNTVGRKPSPSISSMDHRPMRKDSTSEAEVRELGEKFGNTKKELEDTIALILREEEDSKRLLDELEQERSQKKTEQKKKEEQTEMLKKDMGKAERSMRTALQKKTQLEKEVKAKEAERSRYDEGILKWARQTQEMRQERESYEEKKMAIEEESEAKKKVLLQRIEKLTAECAQLETDLRTKREQVKRLEDERKKLPGGENDAEWREAELERRREFHRKQQEWHRKLFEEEQKGRHLDVSLSQIQASLAQIPPAVLNGYNQANTPGADFEPVSLDHIKRRSHHSNSLSNVGMSPVPTFAVVESQPQPTNFLTKRPIQGYPPPGLTVQGGLGFPGFNIREDMDDEERTKALTAAAPLSPSAHKLIPSNMFTDDENDEFDEQYEAPSPASDPGPKSPFGPTKTTTSSGHHPRSPDSGRSASVLSSPHGSTQNLAFPSFQNDEIERFSLNSRTGSFSPLRRPGEPAPSRLNLLFARNNGKPTQTLDEPPPLGSLKHGQSQSFPRQTDDPEGIGNRRRAGVANWNFLGNRNTVGPDTMDSYHDQMGASKGFSAKSLLPWGGSRALTGIFNQNQSSPRPASIASLDLPRPSTDSASIWQTSEGPGFSRSRHIWSPEGTLYSANPSRRPSIHGSNSALETTLASADDEILQESDLQNPQVSPSQVGVIGRPMRQKSLVKTLNPAAPTFMGSIFKPKASRSSAKGKKSKEGEAANEQEDGEQGHDDSAERSESRQSMSVQSLTSVCESHDGSLLLAPSFSNSPSEAAGNSINTTSPDNVVRKLFSKNSSGKFSLLSRSGGSKKGGGPGSTTTTNSERERRSSFGGSDDVLGGNTLNEARDDLLGKSFDSVNSSPSIGTTRAKSGRWFSMGKKKDKGKESLEIERSGADGESPVAVED